MKLLHVDSSITGAASATRQLSAEIVERFASAHPHLEVTRRDLAADPLPHLSPGLLAAGRTPAEQLDPALRREVEEGQRVLAELLAADVIVIGAPMYNFTIPSQLKAWIDRLAVAGKTFRYTEKGPVGLAGGRRVIVASARGSALGDSSPVDHQEAYLRTFFQFLGITELEFVRAEGLGLGPEPRAQALAGAHRRIAELPAARGRAPIAV